MPDSTTRDMRIAFRNLLEHIVAVDEKTARINGAHLARFLGLEQRMASDLDALRERVGALEDTIAREVFDRSSLGGTE